MLLQKTGKAEHNENGLVKGLYFIIFRCYLDMLLFRDVVPEFNKCNFNSNYSKFPNITFIQKLLGQNLLQSGSCDIILGISIQGRVHF